MPQIIYVSVSHFGISPALWRVFLSFFEVFPGTFLRWANYLVAWPVERALCHFLLITRFIKMLLLTSGAFSASLALSSACSLPLFLCFFEVG